MSYKDIPSLLRRTNMTPYTSTIITTIEAVLSQDYEQGTDDSVALAGKTKQQQFRNKLRI